MIIIIKIIPMSSNLFSNKKALVRVVPGLFYNKYWIMSIIGGYVSILLYLA